MDLTATIITTIISLLTIIGVVGKFISNQTKLEVQLVNIQKELAEIKEKLDNRDEELKRLTEKRDCEIKLLSDRVLTLEECNKNRRTK